MNLRWVSSPDSETIGDIRKLLLAAERIDGRPEIEPDSAGTLPGEFTNGSHLLAFSGPELVGYGYVADAADAFGRGVGELIVIPAFRRTGVATMMLPAMTGHLDSRFNGLRLWSHGNHPGAGRLADKFDWHRARELLRMHAPMNSLSRSFPQPPTGIRFRTFRPDHDEHGVIDVNNRAFADHPEQGRLTVANLRCDELQNWFDPHGFFIAEDQSGVIVGFHWTKIHPANPRRFGGKPVGEIYVLGIDPDHHGRGLGKSLALAGIQYLRESGLTQMILYVEQDNLPARALYGGLGFTDYDVDVQYESGLHR